MSDYAALEEVKASLEITGLTYADNDIRLAITAASRGIDEYCGRVFSSGGTTESRYYSPYAGWSLSIDDAITVGTVQTDYDGDGTFETTWVENTDFVLEPLNAPALGRPWECLRVHPHGSQRLPCFPRSVKVTGEFGWSDVPGPVKQATMIMAERLMRRTRDAPLGVVSFGVDTTAVRIPTVDPDVKFLLDPYLKGGGVLAA